MPVYWFPFDTRHVLVIWVHLQDSSFVILLFGFTIESLLQHHWIIVAESTHFCWLFSALAPYEESLSLFPFQIVHNLSRAVDVDSRLARFEERSRHVQINDESLCDSCHARLGTKLFALYPDDSVVCYKVKFSFPIYS